MRIFNLELERRIAVFVEFLAGDGNTESETLHVAKFLHGCGEVRIAIVVGARVAEILFGNLSVGAPGVLNLDAISEPIKPHRRIRVLIRPVKDGIAGDLLQSNQGIV